MRCKCSNNSKHGHLSLLNVLEENNTKIRELGSDDILHEEPKLLIFLMFLFGEGFHCLPYYVLHLIPSNSNKLCIV